ncbi:MAG TPA: ATP-binding protein [archaeon]|nr:ATP-binding protein [archaeon]
MSGRLLRRHQERINELKRRRQKVLEIALGESKSPEERRFLEIFSGLSEKGLRAIKLHDRIAEKIAEEERFLESFLARQRNLGNHLEVLDKFNTGFAEIEGIFDETRDGKKELANLTLTDLNNFLLNHPLFRNAKLGQNISSYLDSENFNKLLGIVSSAIEGRKEPDVIKMSFRGESKTNFYFSVTAAPTAEIAGKFNRIVLHMHDVSRLVKSINRLEEANTRLEYAEILAKSLGVIVHDLKSPMSNIIQYVELLKDDAAKLLNDEALAEVMGTAETIERLATEELKEIDRLLSLRTGSDVFKLEERNLPVFLEGAINTVKSQMFTAGIGWKYDFSGTIETLKKIGAEQEITVIARIDNPTFVVALNNIVKNAVEAIQAKKEELKLLRREFRNPLIQFYLNYNPQKKFPFEFRIIDNGIGISARDEKRINERLSGKSSERFTSKEHGTGWGLKDIGDAIRKNNGDVEMRGIRSSDVTENLGTEVILHLHAFEERIERRMPRRRKQ